MIETMQQDIGCEIECMRKISDDYVRELAMIAESHDLSVQVGLTVITSEIDNETIPGNNPFASVAMEYEILNNEGKNVGLEALPVHLQEYHEQRMCRYNSDMGDRLANIELLKEAYAESVKELIDLTLAEQLDYIEQTHIAIIYYQDHARQRLNKLRFNILSGIVEENHPSQFSYEPTEYEKGLMADECEIDGANVYYLSNPCRKLTAKAIVFHAMTELTEAYDAEHPDAEEKRKMLQKILCPQPGVVALRGRDLPEIERFSEPEPESALLNGDAISLLDEKERMIYALGTNFARKNRGGSA